MADTKITALTAISTNPVNPATFPIPMVDLLDTSMAASGTTKKVTVNQILGSGGTATLASATITGALTVSGAANFNGGATAGYLNSSLFFGSSGGFLNLYSAATGFNLKDNTGAFNIINTTNAGVFTFGDGAGGTRMTLNSTGLGIGVSPTYKLDVTDNSTNIQARLSSSSNNGTSLLFVNTGTSGRSWRIGTGFAVTAGNFEIYDSTAAANRLAIDSSGNILENVTATPPTLGANSQMVFNLTSNTNLRISVRGTDGITRVANITLA